METCLVAWTSTFCIALTPWNNDTGYTQSWTQYLCLLQITVTLPNADKVSKQSPANMQ